MDATGQLTELLERQRQLGGAVVEELADHLGPVGHVAGEAEVERERDEPLLRAVVQVALDAAPRLVAGLDDADARRSAGS